MIEGIEAKRRKRIEMDEKEKIWRREVDNPSGLYQNFFNISVF